MLPVIPTITLGGIIATWDGTMYVAQDKITFAWDPSQGADYYEVQALWIDPSTGPLVYKLGQTSDTQMEIMKPRTGHFVFQVRSCNEAGCSEWSRTDDTTKTQIGKPFRVYFKTAPPQGGITIE